MLSVYDADVGKLWQGREWGGWAGVWPWVVSGSEAGWAQRYQWVQEGSSRAFPGEAGGTGTQCEASGLT